MRASGTEPKIKYYLFAQRRPDATAFEAIELKQIKIEVNDRLEQLWAWIQKDAHRRLEMPRKDA